jgi:hypothetical protein
MNIESEKVSVGKNITHEDFVKKIMAETSAESRMALMRESLKAIKQELDKETGELTEDQLDLVTGGARDTSIVLLKAYCKTIPVTQICDECNWVLDSLEQSP